MSLTQSDTRFAAGTHDNETAVGWFKGSANATDKKYLTAYMCTEGKDIAWDFIREAMNSVARTAIFPLQARLLRCCVPIVSYLG